MGEISLNHALELLASDRLRDRTDGLGDLKHILLQNRKTSALKALDDKGYYSLFQALFRFVSLEKSQYNRSSTRPHTKDKSTSRLSTCASVFRIAVELSVRTIRYRTFIGVVRHIVDALSVPGSDLWEPLGGDYLKALGVLLQYPPHVEHLSKDDWNQVMDFCLTGLGIVDSESNNQLSIRRTQRVPSQSIGEVESRSNSRERGARQAIQHGSTRGSSNSGELEHCIQFLTASPTAPILDQAEKLLYGITGYLSALNTVGSVPHSAFQAFNNVLAKAMTDNVGLVQNIILTLPPIIRKFWSSKSTALKEEMLVTLVIGKDVLLSLSRSSRAELLTEPLQNLIEQLHLAYLRLPDADMLQVDDVVFARPSLALPIGVRYLSARPDRSRSVLNWTTLWIVAYLSRLLDNVHISPGDEDQVTQVTSKRPRLTSRIEDVFRDASSSTGSTRICALQLLPFILSDVDVGPDQLSSLVHRLTPSILDDNATVASWTMVVISSIARCPSATSPALKSLWGQVWDLASRAVSTPATSRAACNLCATILEIQILDYSSMAATIESMISSVDLNGPSILTDGALSFWETVANLRSKAKPTQSHDTAKEICGWLKGVWSIGSVNDRFHTVQVSLFAKPVELLNLLVTCTGREFNSISLRFSGPACRISKAWHLFRQNKELIDYLFLVEKRKSSDEVGYPCNFVNYLASSTRQYPGDQVVLELLQSRADQLTQQWASLRGNSSHSVTVEVVQILSSFCVVAYVFTEAIPQTAHQPRTLLLSTDNLWTGLCNFLVEQDATLLVACLNIVSPFILSLRPPLLPGNALSKAVQKMSQPLNQILESIRAMERDAAPQMDDLMDIDDQSSVGSRRFDERDAVLISNRRDTAIPLFEDNDSLQRALLIQTSLLVRLRDKDDWERPSMDPLVGYLTSLNESDILAGWHFIRDFVTNEPRMSRENACKFLEYAAELCLQSYELERCEASMSACVSLMTCFVPLWASAEKDDLAEAASDLYTWFIDVPVGEGIGSSKTLIRISGLLQRVLNLSATFSVDSTRPSARTSLFKILSDSDLGVKFNISSMVTSIFGRFVLKEHDMIFGDLLESLPRDPDWNEGIALRLYILSQLASQWHTLLRRSIYHIFEAPGRVPESAPYGKACLQYVASSLSLSGPREIFKLFSPQIVYTWTETHPLGTLPYDIFGYSTREELVLDIQDEAVAQVAMRVQDPGMDDIYNITATPFKELLASCFCKAEAYSVARDISIPPSQEQSFTGAENAVRKLLGPQKFFHLLKLSFPGIIATLFQCVDQTEQIEKAFAKRPSFQFALDIWEDIGNRASSKATLPAGQQPSFRSKYLLDELEFVCGRMDLDIEKIWTPTLFCFVARSLLESIHPALGSLHACSVLRKVRILVCLAGQVALSGYPLEMLVRSLRPYVTDFQCSQDAIGLLWYLIENGRAYLSENPSFVASLAVSTLASLRHFLSSSQDSTTQQSHFQATLSEAQDFHQWFSAFLSKYTSPHLDEVSGMSLENIIRSSQNIRLVGSARRGTYEGDLMSELLRDKTSGNRLLSKSSIDLVFSLLCKEFERPRDFRDDILGQDDTAATNAITLWNTVNNQQRGRDYRLWAARAMGRAYAATGIISESLLKEQSATFVELPDLNLRSTSKYAILFMICDLLLSDDCPDSGLAERSLQVIVERLSSHPQLEDCMIAIPSSLMDALIWTPYHCPQLPSMQLDRSQIDYAICWDGDTAPSVWAKNFTLALCRSAVGDPVIGSLQPILFAMPALAMQLLPYILHDVLLSEIDGNQMVRYAVSSTFREAFQDVRDSNLQHIRLIIYCILYLRNRELPNESTMNERNGWLDIDFLQAASAAIECRMQKTALLFVEIHSSRVATSSRRSSVSRTLAPSDLLHDIFKNIDDPDLFYGLQQEASLDSIISKFQHEESGLKNLFFQSANYDANLKLKITQDDMNSLRVIEALNSTSLQGIAAAMFNSPMASSGNASTFEGALSTALCLQQWDIPFPSAASATGNVFKALQSLSTTEDKTHALQVLDDCFLGVLDHFRQESQSVSSLRACMRALGSLVEIDEMLACNTPDQVREVWERIMQRSSWLKFERFEDVGQVVSSREALFSLINRKAHLRSMLGLSSRDAQLLEAEVIRESLRIHRDHQVHQASLKSAMLLSKLIEPCAGLGVSIDAAATFGLANVLWDQGAMSSSIRMLQPVVNQPGLQKQSIPMSRPEILASLGHHIAEARLEKPDAIIDKYLKPAIKELKPNPQGQRAGQVFHAFAKFCDQQLQNPDVLEDFKRIEQLRHRKHGEVADLEQMMDSAEGKERDQLRIHRTRAKQWFDLDDREYQRLKKSRESFLEQCLGNYLQCLAACDTYSNDVLRFCALWLDNSENEIANAAVSKHLSSIPSRKFASLMNQLTSRLLDVDDTFQLLLAGLIYRICVEHPFHGMYQLFATSKSKGSQDEMAMSRHRAAGKLVGRVKSHRTVGQTWIEVHNANITYIRFAMDGLEEKMKSGSKAPLRKFASGKRLEQDAARQKTPPPTMKIELRIDGDYSTVPRMTKFLPEFTVASGVSAPKIVTAIASDGKQYKQLFKGGNDDLRQDAIMEQVFEQVSDLLRDHREAQQRNLGIRTYKVIPLKANTGIIEFVQNTTPLHEYLLPAHQKHFPKDLKPSTCRKFINDAQTKSMEQRVKVFRHVTDHFHPVMRYFFMERFPNPDDWFSKRLAYTRSTAAISVLGYVLGLGDRHGHNILLDSKTGEVVHIDLGVAFEQGRVLPVPEVVPFRLTRDLVDAMGVTKTEGVFRRCCEFTLEALREESYSIMTILDVLRYDPLYSWSLSPVRMKKMQESQEGGGAADAVTGNGKRKAMNEPSEADRALTVVAKKLGKTLSVSATVNELIQQATDERNLAVLYSGWAAYV